MTSSNTMNVEIRVDGSRYWTGGVESNSGAVHLPAVWWNRDMVYFSAACGRELEVAGASNETVTCARCRRRKGLVPL